MDAKRCAKKHNNTSKLERLQDDERYRTSQLANKIRQKFIALDLITTIDISHEAPYHQRNRYENTITMQCKDPNLQSGPSRKRHDYKATTKMLVALREEQGTTNTDIPEKERTS